MNERPTKKQKHLLDFIAEFIAEYGYSPSYREIMAGLSYGSVATVAKHVENLASKGLLVKRKHSARSLEPVGLIDSVPAQLKPRTSGGEKWLVDTIDTRFRMVEASPKRSQKQLDELTILIASLKLLGFAGAFSAFKARLSSLQKTAITVRPADHSHRAGD